MTMRTPLRRPRLHAATSGILLGATLTVAAPWRAADAQKRVVLYFTHRDVAGSELTYRMPGDPVNRRRGGLGFGDRLTVPRGSSVCFVVERANPLLYAYSAASKTVAVPPTPGLETVLAGVTAFFPGSAGGAGTAAFTNAAARKKETVATLRARLDSLAGAYNALLARNKSLDDLNQAYQTYASKLSYVTEALRSLDELKSASDARDDFRTVYADAVKARDSVQVLLKAATTTYVELSKTYPGDEVLAQLHVMQDVLAQRTAASFKQFADANARLATQDLCTRVDADRLRFALSVASLRDKDATPARVVKDSVAVIEVEPQSDAAFEVNPGVLVGPSLRRPVFGLGGGIVTADTTQDPIVHPALFAEGRLWPLGWLWASIGAAKGKRATPDLFFGVVARPGLTLVGTQMSVGAGLGLFQVPVGLREGARVGSALPQNVSDLEKVTDLRYRSGLAVSFNITGLNFGDDKKK